MDALNAQQIPKDEIGLKELIEVLWQGKWLILSLTATGMLLAALASWLSPNRYTAVTVISPVSSTPGETQLGGLGSLASQFGGLASLAGISVSGDNKKSESLAVLQSEALTQRYIREKNLLQVLYRKIWDPSTNSWTVDDPEDIPTLWKANNYFKRKIRAVVTDTKTGLVTLTITWTDPKVAAQWANDLVKLTNDYLREKAVAESERNIAYLNEQARKSDIAGVKQAIYSILEQEINKAMLARGSSEYAFKVLDPATPPEVPSSPRPVIWILAGSFVGAFLSVLIVLLRAAWRRL